MSCSVISCTNNTRTKGIRRISFPSTEPFRTLWLRASGRKSVAKNAFICSVHFKPDDFQKPLRQKLMEYSPARTRKVKNDAIPTLKLPKDFPIKGGCGRTSVFQISETERRNSIQKEASDVDLNVLDKEHDFSSPMKSMDISRVNLMEGIGNSPATSETLDVVGISPKVTGTPRELVFDNCSPILQFEEHNYAKMDPISHLQMKQQAEEVTTIDDADDDRSVRSESLEGVNTKYLRQVQRKAKYDVVRKIIQDKDQDSEDDLGVFPLDPDTERNRLRKESEGDVALLDKDQDSEDDLGVFPLDPDTECNRLRKESEGDVALLEEKIKNLTRQLEEKEKKEEELSSELKKEKIKVDVLEGKASKLTRRLEEIEKENEKFKKEQEDLFFEEVVNKFFSKAQLDRLRGRSKTHWSARDIANAISLRCISPKAYKHVRRKIGYPLPALSTLRKWSLKLDVEPGINESIILLMKAWGDNKSRSEKLTVLQYDETYLSDKVSLETRKGKEKVVGPHHAAQVIMARGLLSSWKQPIFFDYDFNMNKSTFLNITKKLYAAGFLVVASTSDMGGPNRGLLTDLGINVFKTWIEHPSNRDMKIFFFADVPHLLKLLRNHFLDDGFLLPGEKYISKKGLEELLAISTSDLKTAYKLTKQMLDVQGSERQRVSLAAKLFSNNVSKAVEMAGSRKLITYSNYVELSQTIKKVNDWFDVHNSWSKFGKHEGLHAFTASQKQIKILDEMDELVKNMKVGKNTCALPFQNGIIISNESLKGLFNYLKSNFNVEYILTRRLDQDILENFFGFIRSMGRANNHPDPLQFKHRFRLYLLCKHSHTVFSNNTNCEQTEEFADDWITSDMVYKAFKNQIITPTEVDAESKPEKEIVMMAATDVNESVATLEIPENFYVDMDLLDDLEKKQRLQEAADAIANDGLVYVTGYVAYRLRIKYPELGKSTRDLEKAGESDKINPWIKENSTGGLLQPSENFIQAAVATEEVFLKIHGTDGFNKSGNILNITVDEILKTRPESHKVPRAAIELLVRTRLNFRIREFNRKQAENKREKRRQKLEKFTNMKSQPQKDTKPESNMPNQSDNVMIGTGEGNNLSTNNNNDKNQPLMNKPLRKRPCNENIADIPKKKRKCGLCGEEGHTRRTCPDKTG